MTTGIGQAAQAIVARLAAVDRSSPVCDRARAERALADHFGALGLAPLPVRWVHDAEAAYLHVWSAAESAARSAAWSAAWSAAESAAESAARSAAWSAAESAAWSAAWSAAESATRSAAWSAAESATRSAAWSAAESAAWSAAESTAWSAAGSAVPAIQKQIGIWLPFVDAYEAGLWLFFVCRDEVVAVPRPVMHIAGEQLHCENGPAVHWPGGGASYYFWRGLQVPADIILQPNAITVARIFGETNIEIRRVLIERYDPARFLKDADAAVVSRDAVGVLYQIPLDGDEPLTMVAVINSTPEPDGHFKEYILRVPPTMRTARAAVAWSFNVPVKTYRPMVET